jgi:Family of unknown function (DUF6677)
VSATESREAAPGIAERPDAMEAGSTAPAGTAAEDPSAAAMEEAAEASAGSAGAESSAAETAGAAMLTAPVKKNTQQQALRVLRGAGACVAGWAVPGLGHLLLGRWGRAVIFFAAVAGLAMTGYWMRGGVFGRHPADGFTMLGFLADAGSGVFYFLSHRLEPLGANVALAAGDYGTRFLAAAGVLNILCALDAMEIGLGLKQ